eukprot:GHVR01087466.1.p1 GENE.GHVR01087466.1~~GHVR01087466.1.p1  ORF type:complete len:462 (+),score=145.32 GHVR01087466.1:550-1935(+)
MLMVCLVLVCLLIDVVLEVRGTEAVRERALTYVCVVMDQRIGSVQMDLDDAAKRGDMSILEVPQDTVGYVTGRGGVVLRKIEDEFSTVMFFADKKDVVRNNRGDPNKVEKLVIFGDERGRKGSALKVMSAVEQKSIGFFTSSIEESVGATDGFDVDVVKIGPEDFSYALGKGGETRKKLARASNCLLEYVGSYAHLAGELEERKRCKDYLQWLIQQRTSPVHVPTSSRDDVTVVDVPKDCVAFITGSKGSALRAVEERTNTFIFLDGESSSGGYDGEGVKKEDYELLLVFGNSRDNRERAKDILSERILEKRDGGGRYLPSSSYRDRDYDRHDDWYDRRDYSRDDRGRGGGRDYRGRGRDMDRREYDRDAGYHDRRGGGDYDGGRRGGGDSRRDQYDRRDDYDDRERSRDDRYVDRYDRQVDDRGGDRPSDRGVDRSDRYARKRSRSYTRSPDGRDDRRRR